MATGDFRANISDIRTATVNREGAVTITLGDLAGTDLYDAAHAAGIPDEALVGAPLITPDNGQFGKGLVLAWVPD